ncbi:MAG: hypothetical protein N2322_05690, partial [Terrimicrobiaceae bacterium]|nr:hypothetical protein [Terrimicrobiaceae bacterium]
MLAALAACGLAAPDSLPAQTTADRWLEVLESNPANAEALARLLENLPTDQWPEIERRIEALPSPAARLALADLRLRTGGNASVSSSRKRLPGRRIARVPWIGRSKRRASRASSGLAVAVRP